jgi:hypothetical protein
MQDRATIQTIKTISITSVLQFNKKFLIEFIGRKFLFRIIYIFDYVSVPEYLYDYWNILIWSRLNLKLLIYNRLRSKRNHSARNANGNDDRECSTGSKD